MKTELRPYQEAARRKAIAVLENDGGGFMLLPEQRVGKTLTALSIVDYFRTKAHTLLVVGPKAAIPVWRKAIAHETVRGWLAEIHITNYEQIVSRRKDWYKWGKAHAGFFMICDESHLIKSRGASRSRCVRHLGRFAEYRLALTGTPLANGIIDAWAQFDFINPHIFGKYDDTLDPKTDEVLEEGFDSQHVRWGGYKKHQIVGYRNVDQFNETFHKYSYRITLEEAKEEGNQPSLKLRVSKLYIDLSGKTQDAYDELREELQTLVDGKTVKAKNVLACLVKLQQICGGIVLDESGQRVPIGHEKLDKLHEAVRSLRARSKFIVICRYLAEIERVASFLNRLGYRVSQVRGGMPYDGKFDCDCIVMQIQSGVAVDMSKADTIFFYSTDWSYINFEQARFRILSYAKEFAHYVFLLARGTIDELIFLAVTRKKNFAKLVIDTYRRRSQNNG